MTLLCAGQSILVVRTRKVERILSPPVSAVVTRAGHWGWGNGRGRSAEVDPPWPGIVLRLLSEGEMWSVLTQSRFLPGPLTCQPFGPLPSARNAPLAQKEAGGASCLLLAHVTSTGLPATS